MSIIYVWTDLGGRAHAADSSANETVRKALLHGDVYVRIHDDRRLITSIEEGVAALHANLRLRVHARFMANDRIVTPVLLE